MKIAILYICTGRYSQFFVDFYETSMQFLLPYSQRQYFVWTDDREIGICLNNVKVINKESEGFPADSLFRFDMFLEVEEELKSYDYIYFFNANTKFLKPVNDEILPDSTGLAMGIWRGVRENQHPMFYPYERNTKSLAYIPPYKKPYIYYMGGINGGTSDEYLKMIRTLSHNIRSDYQRGIIAIFHDESHINAYLRDHSCKILPRSLTLPEENMDMSSQIIFRDKVKVDPYFQKKQTRSVFELLVYFLKRGIQVIRWYLYI